MTDLLVVCSPGGHLDEAKVIVKPLNPSRYKFVVHGLKAKPVENNVIEAPHTDRDWRMVLLFIFALRCLLKEKPKVVLSTGASIAVPFFLFAKALGIRTIFVESPTRIITPSLTARILQFFADRLYVRYETLQPRLKNSIFIKK